MFSGSINGASYALAVDTFGIDNWGGNYFTNDQDPSSVVGYQMISIVGASQPAASVEVFDENGDLIDTVLADSQGAWSTVIYPATSNTGSVSVIATDTAGIQQVMLRTTYSVPQEMIRSSVRAIRTSFTVVRVTTSLMAVLVITS